MTDSSPPLTAARARRTLVDAGFEVFRTRAEEVVLAERPRENLIMDSGVRLRLGEPLEVRIVLRAQKADYPNADDTLLFAPAPPPARPAPSNRLPAVPSSATPPTHPTH